MDTAYCMPKIMVGSLMRLTPPDARMSAGMRSSAITAHVMPSHQFPTGRVMSVARRYELLGWAAEDASRLVVEDDFDCELRLSGRPVPALASMDATGSVLYLSTFSKSLASALRIAYLVLPPSLDADFDRELGFFSTTVPAIDQVTLARALESGAYASHVRRFRNQMRQVRDALVEALAEGPAGSCLSVEQQDSGIHLVLAVGAVRASARSSPPPAKTALRWLRSPRSRTTAKTRRRRTGRRAS